MEIINMAFDMARIRKDAQDGLLSVDQAVEIIGKLHKNIQRLEAKIRNLEGRLEQYEPNTPQGSTKPDPDSQKPTASYGLDAENKRRHPRRRRKKSPGRQPTELKFAEAERIDPIYPENVPHDDCQLVRERAVWRLENGRAVRVGYRIFAGPDGKEPRIPGVTPRCEYGIEILVVLAFLVYLIGISLEKACAVMGFFCQLPLSKSQADALLRQLAQHWEGEFEILCDLIAYAAVAYMDETGWKVGNEKCSLWAFATKLQRVFLFGCHKDDATLDAMLPPDLFKGIGVSDDASVYRGRFAKAQKCWAHLLRKAIRLAILYPENKKYQQFLDQLLELYRDAKKAAEDGRLGKEGKEQRVADLEGRLCEICGPYANPTTPAMKPHERDFTKLVNELVRLMDDEELFTFVLEEDVEPTNNSMERTLRNPAQDRKAGRTNKTAAGAMRRSVIVSVLESLRANLEKFTISTVLVEAGRWMKEGISLFAKQLLDVFNKQKEEIPNTS